MPRIAPAATTRARALRREATAEERALWVHLRHVHPRFTRQLPVGRYVLDFACRSLSIAVELDGSQHLDVAHYDAERTRYLEALGWQVIRFWNNVVREDAYAVATAILAIVAELGGPTHPRPLPSQEGSRSRCPTRIGGVTTAPMPLETYNPARRRAQWMRPSRPSARSYIRHS